MVISLDAINRITLRQTFLPWFRQQCADLGITLPEEWNPDDAELDRLATRFVEVLRADDLTTDDDAMIEP